MSQPIRTTNSSPGGSGRKASDRPVGRTAKRVVERLRGAPARVRPERDAVGTRSASASSEKRENGDASPRPDVVGTRDGTQSFSDDSGASICAS